ncbi:LCP family protein [Bacillus sp. JJ1533]|uniref:LCP family protein n=1 Tax=Bacillus sp. JJ1533 TaxID=3122959 RepID=UPI002FFD84F3
MKAKNRTEKRKKGKRKRVLKFFFSLLVILLLGAGYLIYDALNQVKQTHVELERGTHSEKREQPVQLQKKPISIALFGVENYVDAGANGRSDTIMIFTLNPADKTVKVVSIPRDTRVEIVGYGTVDKINHAYSFGGPDMSIDTIENFLDIPIDYFATINFDVFKKVVDELGGVTVDVPFDFWETNVGVGYYDKIYFKQGTQKLNGEEALAYVRMRKQDPRGDIGRAERQQQVIAALMDQISPQTLLLKYDDILDHVSDNMRTNLSSQDMLSIIKTYSGIKSSNMERLTIQGTDLYLNRIYYYDPDITELANLQQVLKDHLELDVTTQIPSMNDTNG